MGSLRIGRPGARIFVRAAFGGWRWPGVVWSYGPKDGTRWVLLDDGRRMVVKQLERYQVLAGPEAGRRVLGGRQVVWYG